MSDSNPFDPFSIGALASRPTSVSILSDTTGDGMVLVKISRNGASDDLSLDEAEFEEFSEEITKIELVLDNCTAKTREAFATAENIVIDGIVVEMDEVRRLPVLAGPKL